MPEIVRGSRAGLSPGSSYRSEDSLPRPSFGRVRFDTPPESPRPLSPDPPSRTQGSSLLRLQTDGSTGSWRKRSSDQPRASTDSGRRRDSEYRRRKHDEIKRQEAAAYYDSRAATKQEFRRRASTLQEYYKENPTLLPQLPFTWHHGWRRWKLGFTIFLMFIDACALPIVLYYAMNNVGHVQGWIIFAIVTTVWGGPTYLEFAVRTLRLMKKENFFRPLGCNHRFAFDITNWIFVITITAVTALFIVGSAPHIVWLRVLSMPGPALLFCLGFPILLLTIYNMAGWKAPFRISSTPKGNKVRPGVFYVIEDIVGVNANAGRPYREAVAARYEASPKFRKMLLDLSLFWSVPSVIIGIVLTVIVCVHTISQPVVYGLGWGIPFFWATLWALLTIPYVKRTMRQEREAWEEDNIGIVPSDKMTPISTVANHDIVPMTDEERGINMLERKNEDERQEEANGAPEKEPEVLPEEAVNGLSTNNDLNNYEIQALEGLPESALASHSWNRDATISANQGPERTVS